MRKSLSALVAAATLIGITLTGCSVDDNSTSGGKSEPVQKESIATIAKDDTLAQEVPSAYKGKAKTIVLGVSEYPPYNNFESDGSISGIMPDLATQLESLLDVKIELEKTTTDASIPGIESGRFQLSGPSGDFVERQKKVDFADFAQSNVTVLVNRSSKFTPKNSVDLCGKTLGVEKGAGTQNVAAAVADLCKKEKKSAPKVNAYADQNAAVLALQSNRIDTRVAPSAANQQVEATSGDKFATIKIDDMQTMPAATATYGLMSKKGSGMAEVMTSAFKQLESDGAYGALFDKWNISLSKIDTDKMKVNGSSQRQAG